MIFPELVTHHVSMFVPPVAAISAVSSEVVRGLGEAVRKSQEELRNSYFVGLVIVGYWGRI
jgi:hypothetical protein